MVKSITAFAWILPILVTCCFICVSLGQRASGPNDRRDLKINLDNYPVSRCNKTFADQIVRWLYFFNDPERELPNNHEAFAEFCSEKNAKELYVKEYARRCLAKFPKQVTSLLMFGIIRKNRQFCSKGKAKNEMMHAAHCLNSMKPKGGECMKRAIHDLMAIKSTLASEKIGRTCCIYYQLEDCLIHEVHDTPKDCTSRDAQMIEDLLTGYTGQVVSSICHQHPKSHDHCSKLLKKKEMARLRKTVQGAVDQTYSILLPLIDILDSIPP